MISKPQRFVVTLASVAAFVVIAGCSSTPTKVVAQPGPIAVFPERGYAPHTIKTGSSVVCDNNVASAKLILGGTVSLNGTHITVVANKDAATVSYSGTASTQSAIVNGDTPTVVPTSAQGSNSPGIKLATRDFGVIKSIVLCGGGLK